MYPISTNISTLSLAENNKIKHKRKIVSSLYSNESMSAPELSNLLKISLPTCITLLNDLSEKGHIETIGTGESGGGRKPMMYSLPKNRYYVISCDIARYNTNLVIANCHNQFVTPITTIDTNIDDPNFCEKIWITSQRLITESKISIENIIGIGIDMPGLVDSKKGINYTIKDKKRQQIGRDLKNKFNFLVIIENDARMHGYGEYYFGAAKGYKDAVIIHWSWGIGLALIINGQLYAGNNGFAGEFSHIPIVENGEICICGKRGCLETVASFNTINQKVKEGMDNGEISSFLNHIKNDEPAFNPVDIINWAKKGDSFSVSILNEVGKSMGKGLSYLIQLLNPEIIVLSGPLSQARQYVMSALQQSVNMYCLEKISGNTKIVISDLGNQTALLGTSAMVFRKFFNELKFENYKQINENVEK